MAYNNDGKDARCMLLFGQRLWLFVDVSFFLSETQNLDIPMLYAGILA
jgi:hypothetical protein